MQTTALRFVARGIRFASAERPARVVNSCSTYRISCRKQMTTSVSQDTRIFQFEPPPVSAVEIVNQDDDASENKPKFFPVHRIYCVGRNYADHVREMGGDPNRSSPTFFTKPPDAIVPSGSTIEYPLATSNLHYEVELVIAIHKPGVQIPVDQAMDHVFGYAVGIDLTRRDLQSQAKTKGLPWDSAKAFDQSAPISRIQMATAAHPLAGEASIQLTVNGEIKQSGQLNQMIWSLPEIISQLSNQFRLAPGDLIYTGTPSGVGPLTSGDVVTASVEGLESVEITIA